MPRRNRHTRERMGTKLSLSCFDYFLDCRLRHEQAKNTDGPWREARHPVDLVGARLLRVAPSKNHAALKFQQANGDLEDVDVVAVGPTL